MSLCYKPFRNLFPPFESANGIVPILNGIWVKRSPTLEWSAEPHGDLSELCRDAHMALAWREHHQHPGCSLHGAWSEPRDGAAEGVHVCLSTRGLRIWPEKPPTPPLHPVASVTHDNENDIISNRGADVKSTSSMGSCSFILIKLRGRLGVCKIE